MTDPEKTLSARWSKREKDIVFRYPDRPDGHLLNDALCNARMRRDYDSATGFRLEGSLVDELKARGYDLTTLRFSIQKKAT